jgi:osmotically-inducible protein OsmY
MSITHTGIEGRRDVLEHFEGELRADPRIDLGRSRLHLALEDEILELDGEVPTLAIKRIITAHAAALPGIPWIVDKLRVAPAQAMTDAQIREHVRHSLAGETAFAECALEEVSNDGSVTLHRPVPDRRGTIRVLVRDGIVELDGEVPTRAHRRLAVLLTWWVPGTRDVVDGLAVLSRESDSDDELTDAVRIALEKDPLLDAAQVAVQSHDGVVTLSGLLRSDDQRHMAAFDAWCVEGVRDVRDKIETGS